MFTRMLKLKTFYYFLQIWIVLLSFSSSYGVTKYDKKDLEHLREEVRQMFQHAYDSYLNYAYPYDELRPLSCDGVDTWGSYSLTLIDALDTLAVMGNYSEFQRVVSIVTANANFDANINVSVFETNIRIIGGLLSAHLLSHKAGVNVVPGWPCNGPLLELAEDVARRLIAAFDTPTGMPYGTVNLQHGVPFGETTVTCTAGVGTFILELGTLSRLTGDPLFEEVALNALDALHAHRSPLGLVGNHVDVATGRWTAQDAGIGAGVDSYYEYLAKGAVLLQRPELMHMFLEGKAAIEKYLKRDDWHLWVSMSKGQVTLPVFQSLEAYWPGVLSLTGDIHKGIKSLHNYHQVWKQYGFTPEFYYIPQGEAGTNRESYPLRPELIESVMYLYRASGDPFLIEVGKDILRSIQHSAKTPCGYATIKDVRDHRKEDRMESFFLAETTKYLYLLFDPDNFLHNQGQTGTVVQTPWGECVVDAGGYIFNTEAHPIDPGALHCCSGSRQVNIQKDVGGSAASSDFKGIPLSMHQKSRHNPFLKSVRKSQQEGSQDIHSKPGSVTNLSGQQDLISKAQMAKLADSMILAQDELLSTNEVSQNSELKQVDVDISREDSTDCEPQDVTIDLDGAMDVIHLIDSKHIVLQLSGRESDGDPTKEHDHEQKSSMAVNNFQEELSKPNIHFVEELQEFCKKFSITKCLEINDFNEANPHIEDMLNDIYLQALPERLQIKLEKLKVATSDINTDDINKVEPQYTHEDDSGMTKVEKLFNDKNFRRQISGTNLQKVMMLVEKAIDEALIVDETEEETQCDDCEADSKGTDVIPDKTERPEREGSKSDTLAYQADDSNLLYSSDRSNQQQENEDHGHDVKDRGVDGDTGEDSCLDCTDNCWTATETTQCSYEGCEQVEQKNLESSKEPQSFIARVVMPKTKFDPQVLFERLQDENRYKRNATWINNHMILSCYSQPFLQRLSLSGEMFEVP